MTGTRRPRAQAGAIGLVIAVLMAACAGIPSSGPVTKVAADDGFGESTVRYSPARPSAGASPQQIVRGYLDAMLAFPASTGTASAFLTPEAAKQWRSLAGVRVYSQPQVARPLTTEGPVDVSLGIVEEARLDRQGHYAAGSGEISLDYRLQQVEGEWRISNPQTGLLVNRKFFGDYFRPLSLYFFDRPGQRLVPDPVHLPVGDQLATALVTSLARGPVDATRRGLRTYVPELAALRPSVPVDENRVADVEFTEDFSGLAERERDRLSAQIVWTLRQVPRLTGVDLVGGATPLTVDGSPQRIESWGAFGPSFARGRAYAISGDKVVEIVDDEVRALGGAWGRDARGATAVAVDAAGVAAVLDQGSRLRVTDRRGTERRTITGSGFLNPAWDADGVLWAIDRSAGRTRVRVVDGAEVRVVAAPGVGGLDVESFALSPDGGRFALTVGRGTGSAILVGPVLRDAKNAIVGWGEPTRVVTSPRDPRSVVWAAGTRVAFLASSESGQQVFFAAIDGSSTTGGSAGGGALLPDVDADALVMGTGDAAPRYATDARDRLWYLADGGSWRLLDLTGVTGLTYGR